jgi:hypothetical protein
MRNKRVTQTTLQSPRSNGESGQAIVLIALAAMVLIAIMGLAIDGGRLLFLKREAQNASDAAAIAAARALCEGRANYAEAGTAAAAVNGFTAGENGATVSVVSPPTNPSETIPPECGGCYVEATIGGEIPASFIGIVYDGDLATSGHSVAACNPNYYSESVTETIGSKRALFGLATFSCQVELVGANFTVVGGAHSNLRLQIEPPSGTTGDAYGQFTYAGSLSYNKYNPRITLCPSDTCTEGYDGGTGAGDVYTPAGLCDASCFSATGGDAGGGEATGENPRKVSVRDDPWLYNINDYDTGGVYALEAAAEGQYYKYTGDCNDTAVGNFIHSHISGGVMDTGLYYFGICSVRAKNFHDITGNVTWVSHGTIRISGNQNGDTAFRGGGPDNKRNTLTAYSSSGLLFFSLIGDGGIGGDGCYDFAIVLTSEDNEYNGDMYAPRGKIWYAAPDSTINGCLTAWHPEIVGSGSSIICDTGGGVVVGQPGIWLTE